MNTLDYINKNCKLNTDKTGTISVTMCVSLIKTVVHTAEENEETMRVKIRTSDVVAYLQSKGYSDIAIVKTGTISGKKIYPYVMSNVEIHDIDTLKDLELIKK